MIREGEMTKITPQELRDWLDYNPETGVFTWRKATGKVAAGSVWGSDHSGGYKDGSIRYQRMYLHRAAWAHVHGEWPTGPVDHINGVRSDNRIANLRVVTTQGNQANSRIGKNNTSGLKGVYYNKQCRKWVANICVNYKSRSLGLFSTPEEAHARYMEEAIKVFGEYARAR